MLGLNGMGAELRSFVAREENNPPRLFSIAFEHSVVPFRKLFRIALPGEKTRSPENHPHYNRLGGDGKKHCLN